MTPVAVPVAAEEATARLDYAEDLYRDWNDGDHSAGGASKAIDAEFARIRRELGDLPRVIASPARLRTMGIKAVTNPIQSGVISDWSQLEQLHYTLREKLRLDLSQYSVLVAVAPTTQPADRKRMATIMFETYQVSALTVVYAPVLDPRATPSRG